MYIGGTRGSGIVSSADDVLEMSVVRGVREYGVCFTNPVKTRGVWDVCLFLGCGGVSSVGGEGGGLQQGYYCYSPFSLVMSV